MKTIRILVMLVLLFGVDVPLGPAFVGTNGLKKATEVQPRIYEKSQLPLSVEIARRSRRRRLRRPSFKRRRFIKARSRKAGSRRSRSRRSHRSNTRARSIKI